VGITSVAIKAKKPSLGRLFCVADEDYFFSSAFGASAAGAAAGASAAGAAAGASAAGAAAAGASAGAGAAASSFLPQAARARASREAISNDFFMIFLQLNNKNTAKKYV
jgi:hypothetical protein